MKVFIIDDSEIVRDRLIVMLSEIKGIEITGQAQNAVTGIDLVRELKPYAVVLDIRMPGELNGIQALQIIKSWSSPPRVIIMTNYPYTQYRKRCMEAGADYFLDKSTEFEKLTGIFNKLVRDIN